MPSFEIFISLIEMNLYEYFKAEMQSNFEANCNDNYSLMNTELPFFKSIMDVPNTLKMISDEST